MALHHVILVASALTIVVVLVAWMASIGVFNPNNNTTAAAQTTTVAPAAPESTTESSPESEQIPLWAAILLGVAGAFLLLLFITWYYRRLRGGKSEDDEETEKRVQAAATAARDELLRRRGSGGTEAYIGLNAGESELGELAGKAKEEAESLGEEAEGLEDEARMGEYPSEEELLRLLSVHHRDPGAEEQETAQERKEREEGIRDLLEQTVFDPHAEVRRKFGATTRGEYIGITRLSWGLYVAHLLKERAEYEEGLHKESGKLAKQNFKQGWMRDHGGPGPYLHMMAVTDKFKGKYSELFEDHKGEKKGENFRFASALLTGKLFVAHRVPGAEGILQEVFDSDQAEAINGILSTEPGHDFEEFLMDILLGTRIRGEKRLRDLPSGLPSYYKKVFYSKFPLAAHLQEQDEEEEEEEEE